MRRSEHPAAADSARGAGYPIHGRWRAAGCVLIGALLAVSASAQVARDRDRRVTPADTDMIMPSARAVVDLDRPMPVNDCNRNAIEDGLDVLGIVARGPVPAGTHPRTVTAVDLDGDRRADLVVANPRDGSVTVFWQKVQRRFRAGPTIAVGANPSCVAAGDLDGDGDNDLAIGHFDSTDQHVTVLWNDGAGVFRRQDLPISPDGLVSAQPRCVAVVDLDGDGRLDLLASSGHSASPTSLKLSWFAGLGGGRFAEPLHKTLPAHAPSGLAVADFNGDGRLDVAVSDWAQNRLMLVYGTGAGVAFPDWPHNSYDGPGYQSRSIRAADLDGDGDIDLVLAGGATGNVTVLLNDSHAGALGRFASGTRHAAGTSEGGFDLADLDGDGRADIVVPDTARNRLVMLRNAGDGRFEDAIGLPVGAGPVELWAGNLDTDRHAEIAVTHDGSGELWVLHMAAYRAAPDCNRNGIPDACDIAAGRSLDVDRDGTPDECRRPHPGAPRRPGR